MATLSDLGLSLLQQSKAFYVNPNFSLQGPGFGTGSGTKKLAIDEFIDILPFESYDRNPLGGITASRPSVTEPDPAFLPGANNPTWGVADWFPPSSAIPTMQLQLETSVDGTYETFYMRRIGAVFELDPYQIKIVSTRAAGTPGPDPIPTLIGVAAQRS